MTKRVTKIILMEILGGVLGFMGMIFSVIAEVLKSKEDQDDNA